MTYKTLKTREVLVDMLSERTSMFKVTLRARPPPWISCLQICQATAMKKVEAPPIERANY